MSDSTTKPPASCFSQLEQLLQVLQAYADDEEADKRTFVTNARCRMFAIISALLAHPLGDNMALPFAQMRATDIVLPE